MENNKNCQVNDHHSNNVSIFLISFIFCNNKLESDFLMSLPIFISLCSSVIYDVQFYSCLGKNTANHFHSNSKLFSFSPPPLFANILLVFFKNYYPKKHTSYFNHLIFYQNCFSPLLSSAYSQLQLNFADFVDSKKKKKNV